MERILRAKNTVARHMMRRTRNLRRVFIKCEPFFIVFIFFNFVCILSRVCNLNTSENFQIPFKKKIKKPFFKFNPKDSMISKFSGVFSKASLSKVGCFSASDMKKFDFKDGLLFKKLLTEEENMVSFISISSEIYISMDIFSVFSQYFKRNRFFFKCFDLLVKNDIFF